jgi:hypothetical protein
MLHPTKQEALILTLYHHLATSHWFKIEKKNLVRNLAWMRTSMSINLYTFEISNDFGAC